MIRTNHTRREGTVIVAVSVSLVAILGFAALSLDGGLLLDKRRQVQEATDAAALAAGCELYATWRTQTGRDTDGSIALFAKNVAKQNGYEDGVNGVVVQVHIPPISGLFVGQYGHAEVTISTSQKRYFSKIFGQSTNIPIGARAVARGKSSTINNGIIVLDPDNKGSFSNGGGAMVTVKGTAPIIVDSNDISAMIANGGGTVSSTAGYDVSGSPGYSTPGGGSFTGTIHQNVEPTPDPLRFVPEPNINDYIVRSTKKLQHSSAQNITLLPGVYIGGVAITGKGSVTLSPGIYYMEGGGFSITGQGNLTGSEVMIYNHPLSNSDTINLQGSGAITLTPPSTGPYQGISIFQSRTTVAQPTVSVAGNGTAPLMISGTFYVPNGLLSVTGNGTQDTIGSQYISNTLALGGNGSFNVDWNPNVVPGVREIWIEE
jgi:hypothetical protein